MSSSADRPPQTISEFEDKIRRAWEHASGKDYASIGKDLPRLANRTSVVVTGRGQILNDGRLADDWKGADADEFEGQTTLNPLTLVIYSVARELEGPEVAARLRDPLVSLNAKMVEDAEKKTLDLMTETQNILLEHLRGSRTAKVFQCIHQQMIFPCVERLKLNAMKGMEMTKDVRGQDGWKVEIEINPGHEQFGGAISVMHVRREQSLHPADSPSHWEFEYSVRMVFDWDMENLKSSILRINNIHFHPDIPAAEKDAIHAHITGNLVV
eukprot:TRINITY_DN13709_c0_g1_i1.p1 TRINITY_DN13709_c0_g1~~TRINITY_DN13709_c0_g1_i1.p1  ORF type:complete len:269 (-),score=55.62 TRINITY_DN13709_c0_g1_i1:42-848(-)